mmetsp:Transcript_87845/g.250286  ORF Transcript_87845/g.250286 Transcript_87845/m.250286 type:complete len:122 (-) Transcript_87845:18-383(-)
MVGTLLGRCARTDSLSLPSMPPPFSPPPITCFSTTHPVLLQHPWMKPDKLQRELSMTTMLPSVTRNLAAYNAKRKFRGAIMSVQVLNYLGAAGNLAKPVAEEAAAEEAAPAEGGGAAAEEA